MTILNITDAEYHADLAPKPSLSSSIAKILLDKSPRHAWMAHPRLNPAHQPQESTRFDLGSAAHAMLLERDESKLVVVDAPDWRTKAAREARDAARAEGKFPVLAESHGAILAMVSEAKEAIDKSWLSGILASGRPEQSVVWQEGPIFCRARFDMLAHDLTSVMDYKTADSAAPKDFIRKISQMGYDVQAEFYLRGLATVGASADTPFIFLAQETEPPYCCSLIGLSEAFRDFAKRRVQRAIDLWTECMAKNLWPDYDKRIHYAEPPAWIMQDFTENHEGDAP